MCGRYFLHAKLNELTELVGELYIDQPLQTSYNIAPSQPVSVIHADARGARHLTAMRWGLVPSWSKSLNTRYKMINARTETIAEKPAYRAAFRYRRCLIPASGFYEWQPRPSGKQPWSITREDGQILMLAGVWEHWQDPDGNELESCSVIVREANPEIAPVHDRMPVMLAESVFDAWLDRHLQRVEHIVPLMADVITAPMCLRPVSRRVNNPGNDDVDLLRPVEES